MRTHKSWKYFTPSEEEMDYKNTDGFVKYCLRINNELGDFPTSVLEQSFYKLFNIAGYVNEFSMIDYYKVRFELVDFTVNDILEIMPTRFSKTMLQDRITELHNIKGDIRNTSYGHIEKLINHWYQYGTWKVPIIAINSSEFRREGFQLPYHLFEGHRGSKPLLRWV